MANPELELQGKIVERLKADPTVTALINGRVYDSVPQAAGYPFVSLGPCQTINTSADCIVGYEIFQQVDAWSRAVGYPEVKRIEDAVRFALDDAPLALATNGLVFIQFDDGNTSRDPDGLTSHSAMSFRASVERQ
jgi:Protein of unknown function (DUF3168)